jgi:hypothetical protein
VGDHPSHSAAHAVVYSLSKTMADFLAPALGCFQTLGGVPEAMLVDNDSSISRGRGQAGRGAPRGHRPVRLLGAKLIVLDRGKPEAKG